MHVDCQRLRVRHVAKSGHEYAVGQHFCDVNYCRLIGSRSGIDFQVRKCIYYSDSVFRSARTSRYILFHQASGILLMKKSY